MPTTHQFPRGSSIPLLSRRIRPLKLPRMVEHHLPDASPVLGTTAGEYWVEKRWFWGKAGAGWWEQYGHKGRVRPIRERAQLKVQAGGSVPGCVVKSTSRHSGLPSSCGHRYFYPQNRHKAFTWLKI